MNLVSTSLTVAAASALLSLPAQAIVDLNSNGVSDIWEHKYNSTALVMDAAAKAADKDGDGQSNLEEALAGTDPRNASSVHRIDAISIAGNNVTFDCPTGKGKTYQLDISATLAPGSWTKHGSPVLATSDSMQAVITGQAGDKNFYRIIVGDTDTDGDGIPDWAEEQMEGFDPTKNDSFASGIANNDLAALQALINALNNDEITIATTTSDAFEKEGTPAKWTITRSGDTTYPATVFLSLTGHTNPSKGSVSSSDYNLRNAADSPINGKIVIPAGASSVEFFCHPVADSLLEVPETLTCTVGGTTHSASVRVCDASNAPENSRLLVAQLTPEPGVVTSASGLSTILLQGDNEIGNVTLTFYGLTTPQTAVHIHIKNPVTGPHVESLPMGQIKETPHSWSIRAAQFLASDQAVLDSLFNSQLYVNVHSSNYPAGEIRGDYLPSTGSTDIVIPPNPPAIATLVGDELDRDIVRFLTQSTFGATPTLVTELRDLIITTPHNGDRIAAYGAWIDTQIAVPSPDLEPYLHAADAQENFLGTIVGSPDYRANFQPSKNNRRRGWWLLAMHAPDHLRQRTAFALSEIFVTSENDSTVDTRHYGHAHYYDMLKNGAFGSYRNLIEGVSTHPIMGQYLSHLRNSKAILDGEGNVIVSPDENYAREVMQLFSIGLIHLHEDGSLKVDASGLPIPTYDQVDISAMSRVFTGWSFSKYNSPSKSDTVIDNTNFFYGNGSRYYQAQWFNRMKNFTAFHDDGLKEMPTLGLTINAGGDGESDLGNALDHLNTHPNTAPFLCRRLIQRLVTSNPSAGYLYRVTQVWKSSNGNLGAVVKAILLDYEARSLNATTPITYGKKKEPVVHAVAAARALSAFSKLPLNDLNPTNTSIADLATYAYSPSKLATFTAQLAKFSTGTMRMRMVSTDGFLGQTPLASPTVFNWFFPDYTLVGPLADAGLRVPEFQITNENSVITNINLHYFLAYSGNGIGGTSVPNQTAVDGNGDPHPIYNPYGYHNKDDNAVIDFSNTSALALSYLTIMDTNGDGKVSSLDTTFDNRLDIVNACVALADHLDLLLGTGRLKADYGAGYIPEIVRADNPRDIFINTISNYSTHLDDNDNDLDQARVLEGRLKLAIYLITSSPQAIIQK